MLSIVVFKVVYLCMYVCMHVCITEAPCQILAGHDPPGEAPSSLHCKNACMHVSMYAWYLYVVVVVVGGGGGGVVAVGAGAGAGAGSGAGAGAGVAAALFRGRRLILFLLLFPALVVLVSALVSRLQESLAGST